jgi:hypothetical protein
VRRAGATALERRIRLLARRVVTRHDDHVRFRHDHTHNAE